MSHEAILKAEVLSMSAVNKYSYQVKAGAQYLTGDILKVVWTEFSTLS
jgi:hypothetical protein